MNASITHARSLSLTIDLRLGFVAFAMACALALCAMPAPASASGLTGQQLDAVAELLSAYDVPQATIGDVRDVLEGRTADASQAAQAPEPVSYAPTPSAAHVPPMPPVPGVPPMPHHPMPGHAPAAYRIEVDASALAASVAMVPMTAAANSINIVADQVLEVNYALAGVLSAYVDLFAIDAVAQAAAATLAPEPAYARAPAGESLWATVSFLPQSLYETVGNATDFMAAVEMAPLHVITDGLSSALFKAGLY